MQPTTLAKSSAATSKFPALARKTPAQTTAAETRARIGLTYVRCRRCNRGATRILFRQDEPSIETALVATERRTCPSRRPNQRQRFHVPALPMLGALKFCNATFSDAE